MCVCIALCTTVAHDTAQKNLIIFPLILQTIIIDVYLREGGARILNNMA